MPNPSDEQLLQEQAPIKTCALSQEPVLEVPKGPSLLTLSDQKDDSPDIHVLSWDIANAKSRAVYGVIADETSIHNASDLTFHRVATLLKSSIEKEKPDFIVLKNTTSACSTFFSQKEELHSNYTLVHNPENGDVIFYNHTKYSYTKQQKPSQDTQLLFQEKEQESAKEIQLGALLREQATKEESITGLPIEIQLPAPTEPVPKQEQEPPHAPSNYSTAAKLGYGLLVLAAAFSETLGIGAALTYSNNSLTPVLKNMGKTTELAVAIGGIAGPIILGLLAYAAVKSFFQSTTEGTTAKPGLR